MAKKKSVKKPARKKASTRKPAKKAAKKKTTRKSSAKKQASTKKKTAAKKKPARPARKKTTRAAEPATRKKVARKRKGVRRATTTAGIRSTKAVRKLGRSQIPIDAPLDIVFQNDQAAREAFIFLGIHTVRELEQIEADNLVRQLTSPAKQTVGRIRKILAMNNRCLSNDEAFALEFKERLSQTHVFK